MAYDKLIDSIQLETDLTTVADAIRTKGGTTGKLAFPLDYKTAIEAIETGTDVSQDTVTPETLVSGVTAHNKDGEPITGTNPYELQVTNSTVSQQTDLLGQIKTALEGKAVLNTETWVLTLEDGSTIEKKVHIG